MEKLKPCPFCGGKAVFEKLPTYRPPFDERCEQRFTVVCKCRGISLPKHCTVDFSVDENGDIIHAIDDREEAIEAWNRRCE